MKQYFYIGGLLVGLLWANGVGAVPSSIKEDTSSKKDPYLLMEVFGAVYQSVKTDYVEETDDQKLVESAINGMLTALDPHSGFMDNESYEEIETQTKGEFGGLGIEISSEKGFVRVVAPIDDTPAFKAGLQAGDYITHIDGLSVVGLSLNDAVKKMRGKVGTKVTLTISRKDAEPFDVTITRAIIKVKPVKYEAKGDIAYVRIVSFSETTEKMTREVVEKLIKEIGSDKVRGILLDLRNNPGGLLDQAVGVSDLFLDSGEIVSTRSRNPEDTMRYSATKGDITKGLPIVVLINEGTASAAEIVSGALQDHHRALIVGLKSFGKGSVQTVRSIPGFGGIRLTIARYYTPSGLSIQAKGITPDIVVPRAKIEELPIINGFGEENLPKAISAEVGKKASETDKIKSTKVADTLRASKDDKDEKEEKTDYQLDRAIDILHAVYLMQKKN
ncbi:MAG: S41 family peptidase [Pseudomonadota bacterium]|nr:S41 family peptidase [Pseudomonadota bacterium]